MSNKIAVDLPHSLGAAEAQRRIAANIGKLESQIPGSANVRSEARVASTSRYGRLSRCE